MQFLYRNFICSQILSISLSGLFLSGAVQRLPEEVIPVTETGLENHDIAIAPAMPDFLSGGQSEEDYGTADTEFVISSSAYLFAAGRPRSFLSLLNSPLPTGFWRGARNSRAPPKLPKSP
ncbi:MAG: hypothetical protein U1F27_13175 [Turneriella sp.]